MNDERSAARLTDAELYALFDRLFPHGFAGDDVLAELAPEGWERSPLLACFHPSLERVFDERVRMHRNLRRLSRIMQRKDEDDGGEAVSDPSSDSNSEPTLEEVRREHRPEPIDTPGELTELVGLCLWDVFSHNHDVIAADGRMADIGSFRGAGAFLDEYLNKDREGPPDRDYMRFYMGTAFLAGRADLTPVYVLIFRRLRTAGADWVYHFPELGLVDLSSLRRDAEPAGGGADVTAGAVAELEAQRRRARVQRLRSTLDEANARAREEALDAPVPEIVRAYRGVYGRDPRGWPPSLPAPPSRK